MRLLLVEDDGTVVQNITESCADLEELEVAHAAHLASAIELLDTQSFDLIVCDLRIPSRAGELAQVEHGRAVYAYARDRFPGTPIVIFSAYGTLSVEVRVVAQARRGTPLGSEAEIAMTTFIPKDELPRCVDFIRTFAAGATQLDGIELSYPGGPVDLEPMEKRVIRLFARRYHGEIVHCRELRGGLSGARTLALEVRAGDNELAGRVFAKIESIARVVDEQRRFDAHVPTRLPAGSFATFICTVLDGAGDRGGIFYRLLDDLSRPHLFGLLSADQGAATAAVEALRRAERMWFEGAPHSRETVRDIRKRFVADDEVLQRAKAAGANIDFDAIERRQVQVVRCSQHGDLHGANILVDQTNRPYMIDFGRTGTHNAATDPVSLELSVLFHPEARKVRANWPTAAEAGNWWDTETFARSGPIPDFVIACRTWARAIAADGEVAANAYGYGLRQLDFSDTDKSVAVAIVLAAGEVLSR
jgi:CheY-like chemotaxis protein